MTSAPVYCIDTSSILEARTRSYPPTVFITLWNNVEQLIANGRLVSAIEMRAELERKDDETIAWAKSQSKLFVPLDRAQTDEVTKILADFPLLVDSAKGRSGGDPFLIALAKLHGHTVVTEEKWSNSPRRPKIPNVCATYGIGCITFLDLILRERWVF